MNRRARRAHDVRKRREAKTRTAFATDLAEMAEEGVSAGMDPEQVVQLITDAARDLAARLEEDGQCIEAPWGKVFNTKSLEASMNAAVLMLHQGETSIDDVRDVSALDERHAQAMVADIANGAITLGAAAFLYLLSSPLPYKLVRHLRTTLVDSDGNREE